MSDVLSSQGCDVSVIVVNWNGRAHLARCLISLERQSFTSFEVVLIDNGSSDDSVAYVRDRFPWVHLLALEENRGFAGGSNAGIKVARGELIALLNNDAEADPGWLEALYGAMARFPRAGSCASKLLRVDSPTTIDDAGNMVTRAGTAVVLGRDQPDGPAWQREYAVFGACGAGAMYRRSLLKEIGDLDDMYFLIYEDVDLAFRAQLAGASCVYVPDARVYHKVRSSIGHMSRQHVYYSQRNIELLWLKNMPVRLMIKYLPQRLLYTLGSFAYFTLKGHMLTYLEAKVAVGRRLAEILRKRREIQRSRTISVQKLDELLATDGLGARFRRLFGGQSQARSHLKLD